MWITWHLYGFGNFQGPQRSSELRTQHPPRSNSNVQGWRFLKSCEGLVWSTERGANCHGSALNFGWQSWLTIGYRGPAGNGTHSLLWNFFRSQYTLHFWLVCSSSNNDRRYNSRPSPESIACDVNNYYYVPSMLRYIHKERIYKVRRKI